MIDFEWTVRFGDVLTVLGAAYVGSTLLYKRGGVAVRSEFSMDNLTEEVKSMKDELKALATVITQLAVQDQKITNVIQQVTMLQRNMEDLRRGTGYVGTPARGGIDGEYP